MAGRITIVPQGLKAVYDNWHFAPAVISDGLVFCSGIVGTSPDGERPRRGGGASFEGAQATLADESAALARLVAVRDPAAQFETAFEALGDILAAAGGGLADIVDLTSYHVEITRHMPAFMAVRDRYLSPPYPAWTAIGVAELIVPGGLVELKAVARIGGKTGAARED